MTQGDRTERGADLRAFAALLAGAVAMGISPVFVRLAEVGPFSSAFWRVALALPILWVWMRVAERGGKPVRSFGPATLAAGFVFAGDLFFWHLAIVKTTIANATFFATMAPLFVVIFGWLLFRQKVSRGVLTGLALCIAGGSVLVGQSLGVDMDRVTGDLFGFATAIFFGLYFLAVTAARKEAGAARVTFELTVVTAAILFVVAAIMEGDFLPATPKGWLALIGMAWISHAGGQGLLSIALGRLPAVFSSLVIFLETIAAAIFAWVILGEALTLAQAAGGLAILAGIWVARPQPAPLKKAGRH